MKALVLAGGYSQIYLVKEVKSRGIYTVLVDNNPNAVARKYADAFRKANILDYAEVEKIAKEENVDLVVTACADQVLLTMAKVSENLNLPCYIDFKTASDVSDKSIMKKMCREYGIPTAKSICLKELSYEKIEDLKYPLVVKPCDGYSAKGITKVFEKDGLKPAFERAKSSSKTKEVIIEEFLSGSEVTIDGYCENGKAILLCVSNTEKLQLPDLFLAFRTWYPATISETAKEKIAETMQKIADACHLKNSPMHCQMLINGDDVSVLEFCARTGGGAKYTLLKRATGFDPFKCVVDLATGTVPHIEIRKPEAKYISNLFIYGKPGVFDHLEGFDELLKEGIICDRCVFKWQGAEIKGVQTSSDRIASYTIEGNTIDEMKKKHEIASKRIKAIADDGTDLIRHDLICDIPYIESNGTACVSAW